MHSSINRKLRLVVLSFGLGLTGAAHAVESDPNKNEPPQPTPPGYHEPGPGVTVKGKAISDEDRQFIEKAAKSALKTVAVSRAVLGRSPQQKIRDYALMIVRDHEATNRELKALASSKFVPLPPETKADDHVKKWTEKTDNVENDYLDQMVSDHEEAVARFEKGVEADDPDIAAFARKTLPTLKEHLKKAEDLRASR